MRPWSNWKPGAFAIISTGLFIYGFVKLVVYLLR